MRNTTIFGPVRGRIGNLTAYTRLGKQVFRSVNDRPHNPRTPGQMSQRTLMASIVAAYKILAPFVREAYEIKPPSLTAYNRFTSNNLKQIKVRLSKDEARSQACVVTEYNVSEGTLPTIDLAARDRRLVSSLRLPPGFDITPSTTVGQTAKELVKANAALRHGDKLTVLHLIQTGPAEPGQGMMPRAELEMYELALDAASRVPLHSLIPEGLFTCVDGEVCTGRDLLPGAVAYVHSRKDKRVTHYSTQSLTATPNHTLKEAYESDEKSRQAVESYRHRPAKKTEGDKRARAAGAPGGETPNETPNVTSPGGDEEEGVSYYVRYSRC